MVRFASFSILTVSILIFPGCPQAGKSEVESSKKETKKAAVKTGKTAADGKADAEKDIKAGMLKVWTMPLPSPPWAARHFQLCKDNGITLKSTKSVEEFKTEYISSYNQRMNIEIDKKFGAGFIQKLEQDAQK